MKKLLSLAMVAACALCLFLTGCGSSPSGSSSSYEAAFTGTWNVVDLGEGAKMTKKQLDAYKALGLIDLFVNLDEGGKAVMCSTLSGESTAVEGTWTAESATQATLTINGKDSAMVIEDGLLSIAGSGSSMIFEKGEHRDPIGSTAASGNSAAVDSAAAADVAATIAAAGSEASEESAPKESASESAESSPAQEASTSSEGSESSKGSVSSAAADAPFEISVDAVEVGADYEGNPALIVTYTWKNNSDKTTSSASALHAKCFQNGVQLETAFVFDGIDEDGYMAEVRPGYGTTYQLAYELKDTESPVEIEISEMFKYNSDPIFSKTFEI